VSDTKYENGKVSRAVSAVLISLVLLLMGGVAYNTCALASTNERVARLEAQNEYIVKSLDRIERVLGTERTNR
jgi:monomeric isocitrate dehydrogenase